METKGKNGKVSGRGTIVTPEMKERIRSLRNVAGFSVGSLADKSGISEKSLKKIENPKSRQKRFDDETLIKIAKAFNISFDELQGKQGQHQQEDWPVNFEFLAEQFRKIDHLLLPLIRDHRHASRSLIEHAHFGLLSQCLQEREIYLEKIDRWLRDPIRRKSFLEGLPKPGLIVEVSGDFGEISYNCHSAGTLTVKSPELLWDCHCDTPSTKQSHFKCPIHSQSLGEEVERRFSTGYVLIRHRNIEFYWRAGQELWPPSIDSFYMMESMEADGLFTKKYNSVLDVGSGTGFLGIMTACCNPYITEMTLSDWLLTPYLYGTANWFLNRKNREHISLKANTALFTGGLGSLVKPYDIAICNPPYLPLLDGFDEIGLESTVAGTDLLADIISRNKTLANKIYLQFSSLSKPEAQIAQKKAGVKLRPVGKERLVPFRMKILWERSDYLDVLVKERGLVEKENSRHRFWHKLQTYVIE